MSGENLPPGGVSGRMCAPGRFWLTLRVNDLSTCTAWSHTKPGSRKRMPFPKLKGVQVNKMPSGPLRTLITTWMKSSKRARGSVSGSLYAYARDYFPNFFLKASVSAGSIWCMSPTTP